MEHDTTDHGPAHGHGDGLHEDLAGLASRRDALRIFGAVGGTYLGGSVMWLVRRRTGGGSSADA